MKKTTITKIAKATVLNWSREHNTVNGNPVYIFTVSSENGEIYKGKTRPNAGFVYGLNSSPDYLENVTIAITPSGRVYIDDASASKA